MLNLTQKIKELKEQIINLGYHPDELEHIIKENLHITGFDHQNPEHLNRQIEFLEQYLGFASKSLAVR